MQEDLNEVAKELKRIAEMSAGVLVSEEDVKNKIVLPIFKALGYDDTDFNYESRTGRGYVDVVVEHYPTGIVIESKAPGKKLDGYLEQLETYVFHKHARDRITVAILTDGEKFNVYGVTGALYKGLLKDCRILSFPRSDLVSAALLPKILDLLGKQSNQNGAVGDAIAGYQKERERVEIIDSELRALKVDLDRINSRIHDLETERTAILGFSGRSREKLKASSTRSNGYKFPASEYILRLLREREAFSESRGVPRKSLDEQLSTRWKGFTTIRLLAMV